MFPRRSVSLRRAGNFCAMSNKPTIICFLYYCSIFHILNFLAVFYSRKGTTSVQQSKIPPLRIVSCYAERVKY